MRVFDVTKLSSILTPKGVRSKKLEVRRKSKNQGFSTTENAEKGKEREANFLV